MDSVASRVLLSGHSGVEERLHLSEFVDLMDHMLASIRVKRMLV